MRMSGKPTIEQFKALLASVDDDDANHILWVGHDGVVHLDPKNPAQLVDAEVKFRYETYMEGNGYVGAKAALDKKHVEPLYKSLVESWAANKKGYIDTY